MTSRPLTKALHTRRVVYRLALHLARSDAQLWAKLAGRELCNAAPYLLRCVLSVLDNEAPVSGELLADCVAECERAITDHIAEVNRANKYARGVVLLDEVARMERAHRARQIEAEGPRGVWVDGDLEGSRVVVE